MKNKNLIFHSKYRYINPKITTISPFVPVQSPQEIKENDSWVFEPVQIKFQTPLLVPGVDPFSNVNIYGLDQLIAETKTDLESTTCPLLTLILH